MKVCFIGVGSIATKHIKNLSKILNERKIKFQIDVIRSSNKALELEVQQLISNTYLNFEEITEQYDVIFITNPTYLHYETLLKVVGKSKSIFIEKPIFETTDVDINSILSRKDSVYYIACPLRHTPIMKYVKEYVQKQNIICARAICSSYLPEWRKAVDYRTVYSAKKEEGGGVTLDLIHEWDYLTYLFGMPKQVFNIRGKYSELEINSDDLSVYIAKYKDKIVELHLDYFGRISSRELVLYTSEEVINVDILNSTIKILKNKEIEKEIRFDIEDMYMNEMNYFIDLIQAERENINDIKNAMSNLKIALGEWE